MPIKGFGKAKFHHFLIEFSTRLKDDIYPVRTAVELINTVWWSSECGRDAIRAAYSRKAIRMLTDDVNHNPQLRRNTSGSAQWTCSWYTADEHALWVNRLSIRTHRPRRPAVHSKPYVVIKWLGPNLRLLRRCAAPAPRISKLYNHLIITRSVAGRLASDGTSKGADLEVVYWKCCM